MERLSTDFRKTARLAGRIVTLVCLAGPVLCQTQIDLRTQSRNIDFTSAVSTKPFKSGASLPALCATAEVFFNLNAPAGQNLYVCTALNTWTAAYAAGGIATLNGIAAASQTFTNDTNITITSSGSTHALGWSGALAKLRQNAATVYNDQGNVYAGPFSQDFSGIAHLRLPVASGYTPNAAGHLGYDSAAKVYKGFNGAVKTLAFTDSNITGNAATATAFAAAPFKCAAGNYPLGIDASGNALNCTAAGTGGGGAGGGISLLNGLASSSQTFTNDTNVTIASFASTHVITWAGTLAKIRQNAATVYNDQGNAYFGPFVQDFSAIAHLRLPVAAGYTPTVAGHLGYDSAANLYKGFNGAAVKTLAFTDSNITGNAATATAFASAPSKCAAGTFPLGIDASGNAQNCTAALSNGLTSLNGITAASQTFTNDANITITSSGAAHAIGWSGALAKLRQNAATVYNDQGNVYAGPFSQDFSAIAHLRLPVAAGYTPAATGHLGYDSTANVYKGFNGAAVKTFAFTDSNITGNAATATAFASTPSKCAPGAFPLGIDASGNAQNCTSGGAGGSGTGDASGQTIVPFSTTPAYSITRNTFEAQKITLTANVNSSTLSVASGTPLIELSICQDGFGSRTHVWPANVIGAPVIASDPNSCTNIAGNWDGSNLNVSFYNVTNSSAAPALTYQINGTTYTQTLSAQSGTVATLADIAGGGAVTILAEHWVPFGVCNSAGQIFQQVGTPNDSALLSCFNDGVIGSMPGSGTHAITFGFHLPATWTPASNINLTFSWFENSSGDTSKVTAWNAAIKCVNESGGTLGSNGSMTFPAALADYNSPASATTPLPGNQSLTKVSLNALSNAGCSPGSLVFARLERDNSVANNDPSAVRVAQGIAISYTRTNR